MKNLKFLGFDKYCVSACGKVYSIRSKRFLSIHKTTAGYNTVTLSQDGKKLEALVHRLIAKAYLPNDDETLVVNHKDGDKRNNNVSNLEWVTYKENTIHAISTGLQRSTVINEYRSLTDEMAHQICSMIDSGFRNKDIANCLDISQQTVAIIKRGECYRDISSEYNFRKLPSSNRLSAIKVIKICEALQDGLSVSKIINKFNTSYKVVVSIKKRQNYTEISNSYKW